MNGYWLLAMIEAADSLPVDNASQTDLMMLVFCHSHSCHVNQDKAISR
jgi:hypothetical protein